LVAVTRYQYRVTAARFVSVNVVDVSPVAIGPVVGHVVPSVLRSTLYDVAPAAGDQETRIEPALVPPNAVAPTPVGAGGGLVGGWLAPQSETVNQPIRVCQPTELLDG
jgi:hypothetical protein